MTDISRVIDKLREMLSGRAEIMREFGYQTIEQWHKDWNDLAGKHMPAILDAYEAAVADGAAKAAALQRIVDICALVDDDSFEAMQAACATTVEECENALAESNASPGQELLKERDRLRGQLEAARAAGQSLYEHMGGHNHWDSSGRSGAECYACEQQVIGRKAWLDYLARYPERTEG